MSDNARLIQKSIIFCGAPCVLACDANCAKAWGINGREKVSLSADEDDIAYLADDELGTAPIDPGTYEGGHAKPRDESERLNKWCARECERSVLVDVGNPIRLPDYTRRLYNIPSSDPATQGAA